MKQAKAAVVIFNLFLFALTVVITALGLAFALHRSPGCVIPSHLFLIFPQVEQKQAAIRDRGFGSPSVSMSSHANYIHSMIITRRLIFFVALSTSVSLLSGKFIS